MRKHGGTPSRRDTHVTLAATSPPGIARGCFVEGHQSGLAGCKPPPLFKRGASSCLSQRQRQREPWGASPRPRAPTYLPTSDCATDSRVSSDIAASDTGNCGPSKVLQKSTKAVQSSFRPHEGRGNIRHVQAAARRKARQKWLRGRDDLAVRQDIVLRIERWAKSLVDKSHFWEFTDVFSSKRLARIPKYWDEQKDGLSQPWAGENL